MKTLDEVRELRDAIQHQLDTLPDSDVFGGSNADDREWMFNLIADLNCMLDGRGCTLDEVTSWHDGDDLYNLNDFLS